MEIYTICDECGTDLEHEIGSTTSQAIIVRVDPCPVCLKKAVDETNEAHWDRIMEKHVRTR